MGRSIVPWQQQPLDRQLKPLSPEDNNHFEALCISITSTTHMSTAALLAATAGEDLRTGTHVDLRDIVVDQQHETTLQQRQHHPQPVVRMYVDYAHFPPRRKVKWILLFLAGCFSIFTFYKVVSTHRFPGDGRPATPNLTAAQRKELTSRRDFVKEMMKFAWSNYAMYAWGDNELRPVSRTGYGGQAPFGDGKMGLTIIDSLDTLYLMGLDEEFTNATNWIRSNFNIRTTKAVMSVFEANIRLLGGFLSVHALTGEKMFLEKAIDTADALLPAFNSRSGLPWSLIEPSSRSGHLYSWLMSDCVFLADTGTLHLEFSYLSEITGNPVYQEKVNRIRKLIKHSRSDEGLYPNLLDFSDTNGTKCKSGVSVSVGAFGDSFYEYLFKSWLLSSKLDLEAKEMFGAAMEKLEAHLLRDSKSGLKFFGKLEDRQVNLNMEHLGCFIGGLYAISAEHAEDPSRSLMLATEITKTCHASYNSTQTKLGPEIFIFDDSGQPISSSKQYSLRPEVIESYFYMWKVTGDQKYRDWAWDAAQAIERHCKQAAGYSGIVDVNSPTPESDNVQQSFFLAETLKYLYLIFVEDDPVPLDTWVFNTEAHPLPVIGSLPFKRAFLAYRGVPFPAPSSFTRRNSAHSLFDRDVSVGSAAITTQSLSVLFLSLMATASVVNIVQLFFHF